MPRGKEGASTPEEEPSGDEPVAEASEPATPGEAEPAPAEEAPSADPASPFDDAPTEPVEPVPTGAWMATDDGVAEAPTEPIDPVAPDGEALEAAFAPTTTVFAAEAGAAGAAAAGEGPGAGAPPDAPGSGGGSRGGSSGPLIVGILVVIAVLAGFGIARAASNHDKKSSDAASATTTTTIESVASTAPTSTTSSSTTTSTTVASTTTTAAVSTTSTTAVHARAVAARTPSSYGDDPHLDSLYRACGQHDWGSCDALFEQSAPGTAYHSYGDTCGNVDPPNNRQFCTDLHGSSSDTAPNTAQDDSVPNQLG